MSDQEQKRRFEARIDDPVRQWKLMTGAEVVSPRPRHDQCAEEGEAVRFYQILLANRPLRVAFAAPIA